MPTITRACIKAAMIYAVAGVALSALWLIEIARPIHPLLRLVQPTALHLIVVGWLTQMIFGVALWMFPHWSRQAPHGPPLLAWSCFILLNGGLAARLLAEPLNSYRPTPFWAWSLVLAVWLFVILTWRRARARPAAARG
jgi:hypothetical protein